MRDRHDQSLEYAGTHPCKPRIIYTTTAYSAFLFISLLGFDVALTSEVIST